MGILDRLRLCFSLGLFAEYSGVFLVDPNISSKHENVVGSIQRFIRLRKELKNSVQRNKKGMKFRLRISVNKITFVWIYNHVFTLLCVFL
jgi:hypothetical protein